MKKLIIFLVLLCVLLSPKKSIAQTYYHHSLFDTTSFFLMPYYLGNHNGGIQLIGYHNLMPSKLRMATIIGNNAIMNQSFFPYNDSVAPFSSMGGYSGLRPISHLDYPSDSSYIIEFEMEIIILKPKLVIMTCA
jgi:hypothetical protein